jgi:TonB family protein
MDDAQLPPAKKSAPVVDDTDVFQSCRALYEAGHAGAFGHGRKSRFRIWAGGVVVLGCFAAAVHLWPPRAAKPPAEPSAARKVIPPLTPAPEAISMTTAAPVGKIEPKRPPWVKNSRGVVEVVAEVDEKGNVLRANAVSGPSALHSTAVRAVTRARFHPARRNGIPVKSTVTIAIKF